MEKILKRTFAVTLYFLFWIVLYTIFYSVVYYTEQAILLPQFKFSHKLAVALIAFIKFLPALEIASILIIFTLCLYRRSVYQLKRHSDTINKLLTRLFIMCILASFINITMSEIVRPMLIDLKNSTEILSQRFYENIHSASSAIDKEDYAEADQYIKMALFVWEDNQEALSLKERIATLKGSRIQDAKELQSSSLLASHFITIPKTLEAKEILNMAKTRLKMLDFYTANYYINLVLQIAKDDKDLIKEAIALQEICIEKIGSGLSSEKMVKMQEQFEAKRMAYDALTHKDYTKAYYSFLKIHNDLLDDENKYDPDVEKHLAIARKKLSEEVFFIEELDDIQTFNSSYPVQFYLKDKKLHFNIGGFYFHTTKDDFDIHLSNVLYSTYKEDGSLLSQVRFPYAKIIEKKIDGKSRLYMLVSAISKKEQSKEAVFVPPIDLEMTLQEFNLIVLAQKGMRSMTIIDLYNFIPIAKDYGFDGHVYQAEFLMRFADFFLFIIFTISVAITAFNLRPSIPSKCTTLFLLSCVIFPYPIYVLLEVVRYVFKLLMTLLINIGVAFPTVIILILLLLSLIITAYFLYNIGCDEEKLKLN
ncbi:MAG: hypothetical protein ACTTIZ_05770 [Treponema sp.]